MAGERIFYFCYSHNKPRGGQKHTYGHVDILNANGFDAYAFHRASKFRLTWFENDTRVVDDAAFHRLYDPGRDYLVLPEVLGRHILKFPGRKVIFDKGLYVGSRAFGLDVPPLYPCHSPEVVAVLSISEHNWRHLAFAYPKLDIHRVHVGISTDTFAYRPLAEKLPRIATVPKGEDALTTLHHLLQARAASGLNNGSPFSWVLLADRSERETAQILAESLLFVFMNTEEGFGRMPLEAMASGTLVLTPDAGPLREYVPLECRFPPGDLVAMATFAEQVMRSYPADLAQWEPLVQKQRAIVQEYSLERQERSVIDAWNTICRKHARCTVTSPKPVLLPAERTHLDCSDFRRMAYQYRSLVTQLVQGDRLTCPFCLSRFGRFLPFAADQQPLRKYRIVGAGFRPNARCPKCNSRDRERLVYLYLRGPGAQSWRRILHIAPEPNLGRFLSASAGGVYVSADMARGLGDMQFDLTTAPFADGVFDLIVCNHVLGNIPDDRRAMAEVHRLLAPGGLAVLQAPISRTLRRTYEDPSLTIDAQRLAAFGNDKWRRIYGRDYAERLRAAGFEVDAVPTSRWLSAEDVRRYALIRGEAVFACRRRASA